jgi:flavin-dependent dehydrogenase
LTDLAIVGGGPAGTAAALEARRRGLQVTLWERERFPRDKVCGEFISAESLPILEEEIPGLLARAAFIARAEFISSRGRVRGFALPHPARGLSRRQLDQALWSAAIRAGARVREGESVLRISKAHGQAGQSKIWEIESESGSVESARALVMACGRWWKIEGLRSPALRERNSAGGPWLGVKAHFRGVAPRAAVEMFYFPGGYCGLAPVEDGLYNACCLVHRSLVRETRGADVKDFAGWIGCVARHAALSRRLRSAFQDGETVATAPVRPARRGAEVEGALLAGDAAGFLDPFTGDGISMALHSGRMAVEELARDGSFESEGVRRAASTYRRRLEDSVRRSYAVAGLLRALVRAPGFVQQAAAAALPRLGTRLLADTRWRPSRCWVEGVS